jgi:hypothetical protein
MRRAGVGTWPGAARLGRLAICDQRVKLVIFSGEKTNLYLGELDPHGARKRQ